LISPTFTPSSIFRPCLVKALCASLAICSSTAPRKVGSAFEHGHLGAQAAPDRAHLQADHAGADQAQLLGHRADAQGAVVAENQFFVERRARQRARAGAGGHDDLLAGQRFVAAPRP
jgi:hypothetical protein